MEPTRRMPSASMSTHCPAKRLAGLVLAAALLIQAANARALEPEIGNLVMQQTQTHIGREFYREFSCRWEAPPDAGDFSLLIKERADPRWGSQIMIFVDDTMVYKNLFGIRTTDMGQTVEQAIEVVRRHLLQRALSNRYLEEGDLAIDGY